MFLHWNKRNEGIRETNARAWSEQVEKSAREENIVETNKTQQILLWTLHRLASRSPLISLDYL